MKKQRTRLVTGLLFVAALLVLAGCGKASGGSSQETAVSSGNEAAEGTAGGKCAQRDIFAMDTYMTVTCYGERCEDAADAAEREILRLDRLLSAEDPDSEISRINANGAGEISEDTRIMVEKSMELCRDTNGAFDITVYPVMKLWGFPLKEYRVPEKEELETVLRACGSEKMKLENNTLTLGNGQGIDLGGIAKGYTSDRLMEIFSGYELTSAMISLGGNVQFYRCKPDGSLWKCGIRDPNGAEDSAEILGVLQAEDCAVITSGGYERFFSDENGNVWHHIVDPKTGFPANNGLKSVTIISKNGMLADGLSTACYVMGLENAIAFQKDYPEAFDMILVTEDDQVYITKGIEDRFTTSYPLHIVKE